MKKLATLVLVAFALASTVACGGTETKDDEQVTETPARSIEAATSGGMERGFDEEAPAAADETGDEAPAAADGDTPAPE